MPHRLRYMLVLVYLIMPALSFAQLSLDQLKDKIKFTGDVRARAEHDWDYLKSDSTTADDRFRLRSRARIGATYQLNPHISFGLRIRAGNMNDQQSPHQTWGSSGEDAPWTIGFDKAYMRGDYSKFWFWIGKNDFPFMPVADELYWDNDVTPEGFALGGILKAAEHWTLKPAAGFFIIKSANAGFLKNEATMTGIQLAASGALQKFNVDLAAGYFAYNNMPNYPDGAQTDTLDYGHFVGDLKIGLKTKIPIAFGGDVMLNTADYSTHTRIDTNFRDQKTGYDIFVEVGSLKDKGNWMAAIYYAHIEKYAVVDYLAQDDYVRWGFPSPATGTRSSNFASPEFRLAYAFGPKFNIMGRMYLAKGIEKASTAKVLEVANRFRLDLNLGF